MFKNYFKVAIRHVNAIMIRLKDQQNLSKVLATIQPIVDKYNPSIPFGYHFADQEFEQKFSLANQMARLAGIFAPLSIFISCLGLFGLAMFMVERRTKEITIRPSGLHILTHLNHCDQSDFKEYCLLSVTSIWIVSFVIYAHKAK
jgi:hypothetical protein